jgi:hypothetical protein
LQNNPTLAGDFVGFKQRFANRVIRDRRVAKQRTELARAHLGKRMMRGERF